MNQRIQELMKQSMVEYQFDIRFSPEKFAQLIAEDCARMLDEDSYIIPELGGYAHDIRICYGVK